MFVVLDPREVESLLDYEGIMLMAEKLLAGDAVAPLRASLTYRGSWLGAMPAAGGGLHAVKIVGVYPSNPSLGLPLVRGLLVAMDANTGEPLLVVDAGPPTAYRTSAASCIALRILGYKGGGTAGILGAGVQGLHHARCLQRVFNVDEILVFDVDKDRASRMAGKVGGKVSSPGEIHRKADVIVAATTSREPIVKGALLRGSQYVVSVGAPKPVVELDEEVVRRASCILTDTLEGFWNESGEAEAARRMGVEVVSLRDAVRGSRKCIPGDIAVYKSVGTATLDLAAAAAILDALRRRELH